MSTLPCNLDYTGFPILWKNQCVSLRVHIDHSLTFSQVDQGVDPVDKSGPDNMILFPLPVLLLQMVVNMSNRDIAIGLHESSLQAISCKGHSQEQSRAKVQSSIARSRHLSQSLANGQASKGSTGV